MEIENTTTLFKSYHHYFAHLECSRTCEAAERAVSPFALPVIVWVSKLASKRRQAERTSCVYVCVSGYFQVPPVTESQQ